jgi:hypothetical protein
MQSIGTLQKAPTRLAWRILNLRVAGIQKSSNRRPRMDIRVNHLLQRSLRFQNVFHGIPRCAVAANRGRLMMRHRLHLGTRIRHGNRQPATLHDWQIDYVVPNIGNLLFVKAALGQDLIQNV